MILNSFGANGMRKTSLAAALVTAAAVISLGAPDASAEPKKKRPVTSERVVSTRDGRGVNYSYQAGPHTRVFITRRSWLDAGTEVLPGDRKFNDYAFPPGYNYGRSIDERNRGRNPASETPYDLGGYPTGFPLY